MSSRAAVVGSDIHYQVPNHVVVRDAAVVISSTGFNGRSAIGITGGDEVMHVVADGLIVAGGGAFIGQDDAIGVASRNVKVLDDYVSAADAYDRRTVARRSAHQFRLPFMLSNVGNRGPRPAARSQRHIPPVCATCNDNGITGTYPGVRGFVPRKSRSLTPLLTHPPPR